MIHDELNTKNARKNMLANLGSTFLSVGNDIYNTLSKKSNNDNANLFNVTATPTAVSSAVGMSNSNGTSINNTGTLDNYLASAQAIANANSQFNAEEAEKNRTWQKMMSDTAHQREVQDLLAAGLNPVLSVNGGNGASVGSGATATSDTSANNAFSAIVSAMISSASALAVASMNNETSRYLAKEYPQSLWGNIGSRIRKYFGI